MRHFVISLIACLFAAPLWAVEIQEVTSPGGIKGWLVEDRSIPFVALDIRFQGGASLDAPGKRGAINLMSALLEEGTGDLDARGFAEATEGLAAHYGFEVGDDSVTITARMLTENRDKAVDLLRRAITEPSFPQDAIDRVRGQVISGIQSDLKDPETIASRRFSSLAFGDHPYGSARDGTVETVSLLTQEDIFAAHRATLARDRLFVGASGDISAEDFGLLMDQLLGDLPETGAPFPERAEYALEGGVTIIPFETPQSVAVFGQAGITRQDPDFFPAYILNHILGGAGFESRLMNEVREKRGLTYGIGTYLVPKDLGELYLGQVASANDRIAEAIEVTRQEWKKAAEEGVSEEELTRAKTYLTGAYPLRFDGNSRIAGILAGMQMIGLGVEYINTRNAQIEAVTNADIRRVAKRLLQPENLRFVVVGQPEGLTDTN